ncbi:MAG: hypothetical protein IH599_05555 [Bacteroidales bacterium]|nr:hypothetical protein [Bacteroidales bacterium]
MHRNLTPDHSRPFSDRIPGASRPAAVQAEPDSPDTRMIENLLNYSKALNVVRTQTTGHFSYILN